MSLKVDVKKRLGAFTLDVDFEAGNETLALLGASGCGKTMTLKMIAGIEKPDEGIIELDGVTLFDSERKINLVPQERRVGLMFQNYALFENMTALQNVEYALKINRATRAEAKKTAEEMLCAVGLADYAKALPKNLSGGQQQRVAIARTLALKPDIILFDEPMSALDVATRLAMRRELKNLQASFGTTMIYVTHDQEEAFALSDRIMIMDRGEISQLDTPGNICEHPSNDYVRTFVLDNLRAKIDSLSKYAPGLR